MSHAKKIKQAFEDPINAKIQGKFDLVFNSDVEASSNEDTHNDSINFDIDSADEMIMENNGVKKKSDEKPSIDLDFSRDEAPPIKSKSSPKAVEINNGVDFTLDFDLDAPIKSTSTTNISAVDEIPSEGFSLEGIAPESMEFDESTKKTVLLNFDLATKASLQESAQDLEEEGNPPPIGDSMSTEEAKANIESTIKDILKPKFEHTATEIDNPPVEGLSDIEDSVLDFGGNTPSKGFVLSDIGAGDFLIDGPEKKKEMSVDEEFSPASDATKEFDISDISAEDFLDIPVTDIPVGKTPETAPASNIHPIHVLEIPEHQSSGLNTEDSMRFQATIRALREEREELLLQIKNFKSNNKELEQDNLTLKANLDEAKIEITILRKRQMVELEDLKYRLAMSEEKKAIADERARQSELRREKLEQKVRIDFNQVKQREKELESKLELLSMDVDSQVQSRDHKILELRRKIDALEFNMENVSIKEQKSLDDKRKLEDRLNKIMKTLRHSIKNLEDDIDLVEESDDHQKEKN